MEVDTEMDKGLQEQRYQLLYVGGSPLDARTTLPMLPWLVAGVRRNAGEKARPVELRLRWSPPLLRCVTTGDGDGSRLVFEHPGRRVARFVHGGHERAYFAYLLRGQGEEDSSCPGGPHMECHVFKASEAGQVPEVISSIRQVLKAALKEDARSKLEGEEAFYNSQRFEVLYCGKVLVAHKKVPPTLIDDCIDKFRHHEMELSRLRQDGGSEAEEEEEASEPGSVVEDVGLEEHQGEFRMRCNSVVTGLQKKPTETGQRGASRRRHASAPSHVQPSDAEKNRTMLFQIGRFEINIISPESKTVVLEKNFKDIYSCSQGIKQMDHFGFICRDAGECGQSQYVCYVFQCASESLVEEIMQTLKQAFTTASVLQSAKTSVKLCEACPMHDLHKLCERIEGLYPPRAKLAIQRYISQLSDNEQVDIFERVQRKKPSSDQEENELVINHLRQLCEAKQKTHLHIGEVPQNVPNSVTSDGGATVGRFKLDILRNRARSSLTSSLENIFSRGASRVRGRLGSMGNIGSSDQDDLIGDSPPGTPLSSSGAFSEDDSEEQLFRRRAHTLPVKKKISFCELQPQSGKATDQLQSSSNGEGRRRTIACSSDLLGAGFTPRRVSWRQRIFLQVASPMNRPSESMHHPEGLDIGELLPLSPDTDSQDRSSVSSTSPDSDSPGQERPIRSPAEYQALWRRAVHQQILLLRMEQENQPLEACSDEPHITMMKLDYQELGQCPEEVLALWEKKLSAPGKSKAQWDKEEIQSLVSQGVPKSRRGEVWQLLVQQNRARRHHHPTCRQQPPDMNYQDLLKQLTAQQHAILVDLGRTFPTHQYFSAQLGAGQLSLYNLLKAYSLLDTEVGYCQGISFVAGVLLLHMSEEQAFDILKFLMYDLGFRRQYRPDMTSLQVQMYQLSRLLHDYHRELHGHLEQHEVSPSLYAAPWFLTLFASQYPLGFVARIFDILFVQGTEVIFKIALSLLSSHEAEIMQCDSFETVVDYLKNTLPNLTQAQMERTVAQVLPMNISKQLHAYEVEYHVLQDELMDTVFLPDDIDRLHRLERANNQLKKQNMDLLEKLQASRIKVQSLEANVENFLARESKMKQQIRSLEQERGSYQRLVERMRGCVAPGVLSDVELTPIPAGAKTGHAGQTR